MLKTKKQHYVPKSYLRRFSNGREQLWVFDKVIKREYEANIGDVAQQRYFYDLPKDAEQLGIDVQTAEKVFAHGEGKFWKSIEQILKNIETSGITNEQRLDLCPHITMQWVRTRECRDTIVEIIAKSGQALINGLTERNFPNISSDRYPIFAIPEDKAIIWHYNYMFDNNKRSEISSAFMHYIWFIGVNIHEQPLYTSDNPIVRQAHIKDVFTGGMGIYSRGVEFAYPITPRYILILRERTYFKSDAKHENKPVILEKEDINKLNKLQLIQSTRQIFCPENKFDFARKFCKKHPQLVSNKRERFNVEIQPVSGKVDRDLLILTQRLEDMQ